MLLTSGSRFSMKWSFDSLINERKNWNYFAFIHLIDFKGQINYYFHTYLMYFSKFIMSKDYPYMKTLGYSCPLGQHLANRELGRCGYWYLLGFPCCCLQLLPLLFSIVISAVYFCPNFNYMTQWLKTGHCIIKLFLSSIFGVPISCKLHFKIIFLLWR